MSLWDDTATWDENDYNDAGGTLKQADQTYIYETHAENTELL